MLKSYLLAALLGAPMPTLPPNQYAAKVVRLLDADTVEVATRIPGWRAHLYLQVRLKCINAPAKRTPEGKAATQALADMLEGYDWVIFEGRMGQTDRWGRHVGKLYIPVDKARRIDVQAALVADGHAEKVCDD